MSYHVSTVPNITDLLKVQARTIVHSRRDFLDRKAREVGPSDEVASTRAQRGAKLLLGTNTKSTSPTVDQATGEVLDGGENDRLARASARNRVWEMQAQAGKLLPNERVAYCGKRRQSGKEEVEIRKNVNGDSYITKVQRCGSVHICPCCGRKVAAVRRLEVMHALTAWRQMGFMVSMMTLTLPHYKHQSFNDVRTALTEVTNSCNSGKNSFKTILEKVGYHGQIRAAEVTLGGNGWHPHLHIIIFHKEKIEDTLTDKLKKLWGNAALAKGWALPGWEVGLTLQDGQSAAEYVTKSGWGMAEEVTQSASKKASGGHNPYQLLELAALGNKKAGMDFREYAETMKGKRALYWSKGLKEFFGLNEKTDQQILDKEEETLHGEGTELVAALPHDLWTLVIKFGARADLLDAADLGGAAAVRAVLWVLLERAMKDTSVLNRFLI